jgi:gluconolactonase
VRDGKVTALDTTGAPENPNGVMLSLDEKSLYLGGVNGLYKYALADDGALVTPGAHLTSEDLAKDAGIDGLGKDCAGNIYVTVHGNKDVVVLDANDQQIGRIDVPSSGGVTNVAFGGADYRTLFITSLGTPPQIHSVELGIAGFPY